MTSTLQNTKIKSAILGFLKEQAPQLDEAFHAKDRAASVELGNRLNHHYRMLGKHEDMLRVLEKDKDKTEHDLAILAHRQAISHYGALRGADGLPGDYHSDRDWYDKLNDMVSGRADKKSKGCGVSCD